MTNNKGLIVIQSLYMASGHDEYYYKHPTGQIEKIIFVKMSIKVT